jgi:hypothetical protein
MPLWIEPRLRTDRDANVAAGKLQRGFAPSVPAIVVDEHPAGGAIEANATLVEIIPIDCKAVSERATIEVLFAAPSHDNSFRLAGMADAIDRCRQEKPVVVPIEKLGIETPTIGSNTVG